MFYSNDIQTIFKAAGLQLTVKETERAGHATDIVRALTPGSCDAIVTVGGDGTVFEALQVTQHPALQSGCKDTRHQDIANFMTMQLGTKHCILTTAILLSKDKLL